MKEKFINPSKLTICGYGNSTRISITKISFPGKGIQALFYDKLKSVYQNATYGPAKEYIAETLWEHVVKGLKHYNHKMNEPFIQVFYDHQYIGVIHQDLKKWFWVCKECKQEYEVIPEVPFEPIVLSRWQSFLKFFFPGAFEPPVLRLPNRACQCGKTAFFQDYI